MIFLSKFSCSFSGKKWEWDDDAIVARTISDGVAEILTRRLLRLPKSVVSALRVVSTFGSSASMQVLTLLRGVCGNSDILKELDRAVGEGLVQKDSLTCSFPHDLIQHAVQTSITADERTSMLQEIADALLSRTAEDRADDILFVLVGLINRLGPENSRSTDHVRYALLNLRAGEKVCILIAKSLR